MNVHQFLTSYSYGDAIGNEALEIRDFLRSKASTPRSSPCISIRATPTRCATTSTTTVFPRPATRCIYHFSIGSPVTKKFLRLRDRKVIIYHNITPYHFFLDFHRILAKDCFKGRLELKSLAGEVDLALGDSEYNRQELVGGRIQEDRRPAPGHGFRQVRPAGAAGFPGTVRRPQDQPALRRAHHSQQEGRRRHQDLPPLSKAFQPRFAACSSSANTAVSSAISRPCRS